jgi:hypothetical protein
MLKIAEVEIKNVHTMLMVNKSTEFKKHGRKTKGLKVKRPQNGGNYVASPPKAPKANPGVSCFYCKEEGHWKRKYPKYPEDKEGRQDCRERQRYL